MAKIEPMTTSTSKLGTSKLGTSKSTRRSWLRGGGLAAASLASGPLILTPGKAKAADQLVVVSFGGGWAEAMTEAYHKPFTAETGIQVVVADGIDLAKAKAQVQTKNIEWDIMELGVGWLPVGLRDGLWERLDPSIIDFSDTVPGTQHEYAIGQCTYSGGIAWNTTRHPEGKHPTDWQGFWDVNKYPGRRGILTRITGNLEYALMADGVDPKKLYPLDVERGFKSLDRLKPHVSNWIGAMPQTISLLQRNEVDFVTSGAGRVFIARNQGIPLDFAFESALIDVGRIAMLKGTKKRDLAMRHMAFVMRPDRQAHFAKLTSYAGTKLKGIAMLPPEILKLNPSPSWPKTALNDEEWWTPRLDELTKRFKEWQLT